eukprot:COSAG05_NODE_1375_length_5050_cov_3.472632_1_plen_63_part_00
MDGGSQGAASAFWATASQGEVVTFFRHLGEDVSMPTFLADLHADDERPTDPLSTPRWCVRVL